MSTVKKWTISCGLVVTLLGGLVAALLALNWSEVSGNLARAWHAQQERTSAALFRWGELASLAAEFEREYGVKPAVDYHQGPESRVLVISYPSAPVPECPKEETLARELASFALRNTAKLDQVDIVDLRLTSPATTGAIAASTCSYQFKPDEWLEPRSR